MTRDKIAEAMRTLRQLASDPTLKKRFKSDERKVMNDAANILSVALANYPTGTVQTDSSV